MQSGGVVRRAGETSLTFICGSIFTFSVRHPSPRVPSPSTMGPAVERGNTCRLAVSRCRPRLPRGGALRLTVRSNPLQTTLSLSPMPTALAAALAGQKQIHFLEKASMSFCNAVRNPTPRIAPRHSPMPISMDTPFAAFSFAAAGARPADAGAHTLIQLAASTAIRSRARTISAARHAPGPPVSWGRQQRGSVGVVRANRGQVRSGTLLLLAAAGALGTLCVPESHAQSYVMLTRSGAGGRTEPGPNLARLNCFSRQPARQHSSNWDKVKIVFFLDDTSLHHGGLVEAAVLKAADACASCERALTVTTVGLTDRAAMSCTCADAFLRAVLEARRPVG